MSIEKHLATRGIELGDDNSLPQGQRSQKVFKRVIAAIRAAEAESGEELRDANERCRVAQSQVIELQARLVKLEAELRRHKVEQTVEGMADRLTVVERKALIGIA